MIDTNHIIIIGVMRTFNRRIEVDFMKRSTKLTNIGGVMNNNILTKMVIACLCCCTMLVAKTHIDDQVDADQKAKIELEQQRETELNQPIKTQPSAQELLEEKKSRTKESMNNTPVLINVDKFAKEQLVNQLNMNQLSMMKIKMKIINLTEKL
jgi:septal ring factor EnvC (AmiA/AmiB activator)